MKARRVTPALLAYALAVAASASPQRAAGGDGARPSLRWVATWAGLRGPGQFETPKGVALDAAGYAYVVDAGNRRLQKLRADGTPAPGWSTQPQWGADNEPVAVAVDRQGNAYVTDRRHSSVEKIDAGGTLVLRWPIAGPDLGHSPELAGIAVGPTGEVYVAASRANRVLAYSPLGAPTREWGTRGSDDGEFQDPQGVAVDAIGNVYVADRENYRIQKFSAAGAFLKRWGGDPTGDGQLMRPSGLAVDRAGFVYALDTGWRGSARPFPVPPAVPNPRVLVFDQEGRWQRTIPIEGSAHYLWWIAVDAQAHLYLPDHVRHRVQRLAPDGAVQARWGGATEPGQFGLGGPTAIGIDRAGDVFVADTDNRRVQKFSPAGKVLAVWGTRGPGAGQFDGGIRLAVDPSGAVYVTDFSARVQKFASDGTFVTAWGSAGAGDGQFGYASHIAVGPSGDVYVSDSVGGRDSRIQRFTGGGRFVASWIIGGTSVQRLAVDGRGGVHVVTRSAYGGTEIRRFGPAGEPRPPWRATDGSRMPMDVKAIAFDGANNLYIATWRTRRGPGAYVRVEKYSPAGDLLDEFGGQSRGSDQLEDAAGIAIDGRGRVYVTDLVKVAVLVFEPAP